LVECANYEVHYYYVNFSIILLTRIRVSNIPVSLLCSEIPTSYGLSLGEWIKLYTHSK